MNQNIEPLTTDSTPAIVRAFFDFVSEADQSGNKFPVDFDMVWPLAYGRKDHAKRALIADFFDNEDYRIINKEMENTILISEDGEESHHLLKNADVVDGVFRISAENSAHHLPIFGEMVSRPQGGGPQPEKIFLSIKCMEFFVARKVRPIFEIYRQCRLEIARIYGVRRHVLDYRTPKEWQNETVMPILVAFIQQTGNYAGRVSDLKANLERLAPNITKNQNWPRSASRFGECLSRLGPALSDYDIEFVRGARWGSGQRVRLHITRQLPGGSFTPRPVPQLDS